MAILTVYDEQFPCSVAMKGDDYIRLLDEEGNVVFFADGITDFSPYILDGSWEYPYKRSATIVSCTAALVDGVLTLTPRAPTKIESFTTLVFQAPCDCNMFSSLSICDKTYDVVDAMGKSIIGGSGGAWCKNAYVSLLIDHVNKKAYILNDATASNKIAMELLWENASPTSSFIPQDINLDLTDYWGCYILTNETNAVIMKGVYAPIRYLEIWGLNSTDYKDKFRTVEVRSTNVVFIGDCYYLTPHTTGGVANDSLIPLKIYGIKGVQN